MPRFKIAKLSMRPQQVCALFGPEENELTDSPCRPANLILALNQLVDALTGLERILTTPIPYSSVVLCSQSHRILICCPDIQFICGLSPWFTASFWYIDTNLRRLCLFTDMFTQPFQLWPTLKYLTIPGTVVVVRLLDGSPLSRLINNPF